LLAGVSQNLLPERYRGKSNVASVKAHGRHEGKAPHILNFRSRWKLNGQLHIMTSLLPQGNSPWHLLHRRVSGHCGKENNSSSTGNETPVVLTCHFTD